MNVAETEQGMWNPIKLNPIRCWNPLQCWLPPNKWDNMDEPLFPWTEILGKPSPSQGLEHMGWVHGKRNANSCSPKPWLLIPDLLRWGFRCWNSCSGLGDWVISWFPWMKLVWIVPLGGFVPDRFPGLCLGLSYLGQAELGMGPSKGNSLIK